MARRWFTISSGCALVEQLGERVVSYGKEERERERERALFYLKNRIDGIKKKLSLLSYSKLSSFVLEHFNIK